MDNSIGEEGTTNNKFDVVSITYNTIVEERALRASKSVDEDAVEKDAALTCQEDCAESQSGECAESASVQTINPDAKSKEHKNLFHRVKRERPGRDQTSEVSSGNTRSELRRRQQRRVIEDANEDCQSAPDAIH